ncbi:MAG: acyl-CoA reductase [Saprospiraceae bacterium]
MTLQQRIDTLVTLGERLQSETEIVNAAKQLAYIRNKWFTVENSQKAIDHIVHAFLQRELLENWAKAYNIDKQSPKKVGLVMAGNIPLVGFHDFMSVFLAGHEAKIKLSEKDTVLMELVFKLLKSIDSDCKNYIEIIDRLTDFEAVIATGSNSTVRYFEVYFGKVPNIIRRNGTSVAVLTGEETKEDLLALGVDIFEYFGLGSRNVSKLYLPKGYDFNSMMEVFHSFKELVLHNKYKNNYDYSYTLLTMNKIPTVFGTCILLSENESLQSRISQVHYGFYDDQEELKSTLEKHQSDIQYVVSKNPVVDFSHVPFGQTQTPSLTDYVDGVDTMAFLTNL